MKSPELEQSICITCGFCCDGTLFDHAILQPGEKGHLPQYMEDNYTKTKEKEFFLLPCDYFNGKCSIYNEKKALVCSSYRCQLLKDFSSKRIDLYQALKIVANGKLMREDVFTLYSDIFQIVKKQLYFRLIYQKLVVDQKEQSENIGRSNKEKILIGKCNIFEALLTRYFKSKDDYNQMIQTEDL